MNSILTLVNYEYFMIKLFLRQQKCRKQLIYELELPVRNSKQTFAKKIEFYNSIKKMILL